MTKDEKIAKLGKVITDRATVLLGKDKITPDSPEYLGINSALKFTAVKYDKKMADDILDIALTMKKRVPLTIEQLAKKNPQFDRAYLEKAMQAISESGLVEFHWENLDGKNPNHEKRWVLDMFVPGSAEIMMINPEQSDMFPETADFFERMAYLPLAGITEMVPPGGAGIGMHVIPVEKAIDAASTSVPIEHIEHWLDLGGEDVIALGGDWDGATVPAFLSDASKMPEFQNMLSKHFGKTVMQKLCSDNALAFFERY
mgnify:CR=1 FL=1